MKFIMKSNAYSRYMLHKLSMIIVRLSLHCAMITLNSKENIDYEKYGLQVR